MMARGSGGGRPPGEEEREEALARLEQIQSQTARKAPRPMAGGDEDPDEAFPPPPLDWRMTPRNVILQIAAILLFIGVVWFLVDLFVSGFAALLR